MYSYVSRWSNLFQEARHSCINLLKESKPVTSRLVACVNEIGCYAYHYIKLLCDHADSYRNLILQRSILNGNLIDPD